MSALNAATNPEIETPPLPGLAMDDLEILVVEDDAGDAYLIETALSRIARVGCLVRASDGVEAMALIEKGVTPDLALIDLHMPRKSGFNLLLELSCAGHDFPMVVLTSSTARADLVRSKLRGATQVLSKPDTVAELTDMLRRVVAEV